MDLGFFPENHIDFVEPKGGNHRRLPFFAFFLAFGADSFVRGVAPDQSSRKKDRHVFFFDAKTTSFCLKLIESVTWVTWTPPQNARQCLLDDSFEVTSSDGVPPNRIPGFLQMRSPTPKPSECCG